MSMINTAWDLSEKEHMESPNKCICICTKKNNITITFGGNLGQEEMDQFLLCCLINSNS